MNLAPIEKRYEVKLTLARGAHGMVKWAIGKNRPKGDLQWLIMHEWPHPSLDPFKPFLFLTLVLGICSHVDRLQIFSHD